MPDPASPPRACPAMDRACVPGPRRSAWRIPLRSIQNGFGFPEQIADWQISAGTWQITNNRFVSSAGGAADIAAPSLSTTRATSTFRRWITILRSMYTL